MALAKILATVRERSNGAGNRLRRFLRRAADTIGVGPSRVLARVRSLWANKLAGTETLGQTLDRQDNWYIWRFGATERHCRDCAALQGQVHRASEWRAAGIMPQSPDLECGGWRCDCRLEMVPGYQGAGEGRMDYWRGEYGENHS